MLRQEWGLMPSVLGDVEGLMMSDATNIDILAKRPEVTFQNGEFRTRDAPRDHTLLHSFGWMNGGRRKTDVDAGRYFVSAIVSAVQAAEFLPAI